MSIMFPTRSTRRKQKNRAFTLLEILIALAIIGLIVGVGVANLDKIFGNAQVDISKSFVQSGVKIPLTAYRMAMGDYPSTAEGLQALEAAPKGREDRWAGPYVEGKIPLDPFGEPYQYRYPGVKNKTSYDIWSKGKDKLDGTADDIGNWVVETAEK